MSQGLDNATRLKLETLLGMGSGYVLDFSNPTFRDFVYTSVGLDPYEQYEDRGSKANILRAIWSREPSSILSFLIAGTRATNSTAARRATGTSNCIEIL